MLKVERLTRDRRAKTVTKHHASRAPRHTRKKPAIRSEEILRVSCDILVNEGYAALNLRRVAALAGIRLGTLQYYFPTREQLLTATLERIITKLTAGFDAVALDLKISPKRRLKRLCELALQLFVSKPNASVTFEIFALAQHEPFVKAVVDRRYAWYTNLFERILKELAPNCPDSEIGTAARLITSLLEGLMFFGWRSDAVGQTQELVDEQLDQLILLCIRMVKDAPANRMDPVTRKARLRA